MFQFAKAAATAGIIGGGIGQFAFTHNHSLMTFDVSPTSFKSKSPGGVEFLLGPERTGFVVTNMSRYYKVLSMRPVPQAPLRIMYETSSLGFSVEYLGGATLSAKGASAPFLTWSDGSVGPGVPAAPSKWLLLTWPEPRPPLLFCFTGLPASVTATPTSDGFTITIPKYTGVVRIRQPFGNDAIATQNASEMGKLAERLRPLIEQLSKPAPVLQQTLIEDDKYGPVITWIYDKPGAVLPAPLTRGFNKGNLKILSNTTAVGAKKDVLQTAENELKVKFITHELRPGTPVVFGNVAVDSPATISYIDPQSVAEATMSWLFGNGDSGTPGILEEAFVGFSDELKYETDPVTQSRFGFAKDGTGAALLAAHCFSQEARNIKTELLSSLFDSLDWVTWQPAGATRKEKETAAALLALCCAFRKSPEERALGAMASLGASDDAPYSQIRNGIYSNQKMPDWFSALESPVRSISPDVSAKGDKTGIVVFGDAQSVNGFYVELLTDADLRVVSKVNVKSMLVASPGLHTSYYVVPERVGPWKLTLARKAPGRPIPRAAPSPRYSEARR